jgi:hypothetical protein
MRLALSVLLVAAFVCTDAARAQAPLRVPRVSPGSKVSQMIGLSEVSISYHRPGVKGRNVFGDVVKYGEVWRAGANEPTVFTFSDEVTIAGKKLSPGSYRFVVFPAKEGEWGIAFNSEVKNWGTVYEAAFDTLRFSVKPGTGLDEEWMSFSFTDLSSTSARVVLAWGKVRLSFVVEFNTLAKLQSSMGTWQMLHSSARFALDNGLYLNEAMGWIERSIALDKNGRNLQTKAELFAKMGNVKEAIVSAEEAITITKARDPKANTEGLEKLILGWKK